MNKDAIERRRNMMNIISQNEEFIIIGLTGRIGSGCTEAAEIFSSTFQDLELPWIQPGSNGLENNQERERRILQRYASAHWLKFDIIRTRSIITSFLIDDLNMFIKKAGDASISKENIYNSLLACIKKDDLLGAIIDSNAANKISNAENWERKLFDMLDGIDNMLKRMGQNELINRELFYDIVKFLKENDFVNINAKAEAEVNDQPLINLCATATNELRRYYQLIETSDDGKCECDRGRFIPQLELILCYIAKLAEAYIISNTNSETLWITLKKINISLDTDSLQGYLAEKDQQDERYKRFVFVHDIANDLGNALHELIKNSNLSFTELFQKFGNNIRCYGKIIYNDEIAETSDIFSIPRKIVQFIKVLRHPFFDNSGRPVRIVIDSIKSVFEADYLRQRYSSFYLFAISADDSIRKKRLMNNKGRRMTMQQIKFVDWNEYSSEGCKIYNNSKNYTEGDEKEFIKHINGEENNILYDSVRKRAYENNLQQFYLQDVAASIENADIFISNNHDNTLSKNMELRWSIVRNVCLIMFPGLLTPTPIERCMQIAFAAKCNSGCLSRQVGAVVTDKDYNILSIGWNDVPCGDVSCAHKNLVDLCKWEDKNAYTNYELEDVEFRNNISRFKHQKVAKILLGLPMRYCFKDIHMKEKNPMRSRSMHAEEKALAICGDLCKGGCLFTTSSPCEMCSKNAKNHQIKKIYYIELYPGISETQYSNSGDKNNIAEHILFTGAIGRAYTKMYTPFMPQKDILSMLGIFDECWPDRNK